MDDVEFLQYSGTCPQIPIKDRPPGNLPIRLQGKVDWMWGYSPHLVVTSSYYIWYFDPLRPLYDPYLTPNRPKIDQIFATGYCPYCGCCWGGDRIRR